MHTHKTQENMFLPQKLHEGKSVTALTIESLIKGSRIPASN